MAIPIIFWQYAAPTKQARLLRPRWGLININHYPRVGSNGRRSFSK